MLIANTYLQQLIGKKVKLLATQGTLFKRPPMGRIINVTNTNHLVVRWYPPFESTLLIDTYQDTYQIL